MFSKANLVPIINSLDEYEKIKKTRLKYAIHVDTGIHRLGISMEDLNKVDTK